MFEHHEGIKDSSEPLRDIVTPIDVVHKVEPAAHEIKSLPHNIHHAQHFSPKPPQTIHHQAPLVSSLPQRHPSSNQGSFVPFVHNLHAPTSNIPKIIFAPLHKGPKPILVEIGRQVLPNPIPPSPAQNQVFFTTPKPFPALAPVEETVVFKASHPFQELPQISATPAPSQNQVFFSTPELHQPVKIINNQVLLRLMMGF